MRSIREVPRALGHRIGRVLQSITRFSGRTLELLPQVLARARRQQQRDEAACENAGAHPERALPEGGLALETGAIEEPVDELE
jgi:hypothetical protein